MMLSDLHPIPNGALFHGAGPVTEHHRELAQRLGLCVRVLGQNVYLCQPHGDIEMPSEPPVDYAAPAEPRKSLWRYAMDAWLRHT